MNQPGIQRYIDLVVHDFNVLGLLTRASRQDPSIGNISDWQVTLLFYICCVYAKAACKTLGVDIQDHFSLRQFLNTEPRLVYVARSYRKIEEASRDARYEGRTFDIDYIRDRILPNFISVRDAMVNLLEQQGVINVPKIDPGLVIMSRR